MIACKVPFIFYTLSLASSQYIGPDEYREGYATGPIVNLCTKPEEGRLTCNIDLICEDPTLKPGGELRWAEISASSQFVVPDKKQPNPNPSITTSQMVIDGSLTTKWWSAWDELEAWVEINLNSPIDRIQDADSYNFFTWKFKDQIEAGKDINYLKDGLIGFHIDKCIIRWDGWYSSMDYKVMSSLDRVQWKDRIVKQNMPTEFDRVDELPGWSTQGPGNTRYVKIQFVTRVIPLNDWGTGLVDPLTKERTAYGIREIELIGPEPSEGYHGTSLSFVSFFLSSCIALAHMLD